MQLDSKTEEYLRMLQNPEYNPRKAATKLKQVQLNIESMRNRFKVLQGQDQYNRYKTIDHSKKISHHSSIHQAISKQKQQLKKSMGVRAEIGDSKSRNVKLRTEMKSRIAESRRSMLTEKAEKTQLVAGELAKNEQAIKQFKQKDNELNKVRKSLILKQEEEKRQNLKKYYANKLKYTLLEKQRDASIINRQTKALHEELATMMSWEKQLMERYSNSLRTSQIMKSKYNQILNASQKSSHSQKLPEIKNTSALEKRKQ